ncbi:MAG: DUF5037 domain-containing protein [Clostridiales bacterium]|nr:DUF5037 domain-containing protein [Clostridiales bacterium]
MVVIISTFLGMVGCITTEKEKRIKLAEDKLQEKYNEEFQVTEIWGKSRHVFGGVCSPKSDPTLKFEGTFSEKENVEHMDEYVEATVAREVENNLMPDVNKIAEEVIIKPFVSYRNVFITNIEDMTISNYINIADNPEVGVDILIMKSSLKNIGYENEYKIFESIKEKAKFPKFSVGIYYLENEDYKQCIEYFERNARVYGSYFDIVRKYKDLGFGYPKGQINMSLEKFITLRESI